MSPPRDAVIGAGIVGLALAYALARRGRDVVVFDATPRPEGASVRNFGTLWPIGQPVGPRRAMALDSLRIWREVLAASGTWFLPCGSLHVAYHDDECRVLEEFAASAGHEGFECRMLTPADVLARQPRIRRQGLKGALSSTHELQVNSRDALVRIPQWLTERYGVQVVRGTRITSCAAGVVGAGAQRWHVDRVWLAGGDDLQTLYPEALSSLGLRRCKLQMMRTAPVPWGLQAILAAGLTLGHYESFQSCPSLGALKVRLVRDWPEHVALGVHVLVAQHDGGHLVLGDSHEYDEAISPFDRPAVDDLVLAYLDTFLDIGPVPIIERWHGIYLRHPRDPYCVLEVEPGVAAVVGLGGHGMTLSFGLAERVVASRIEQ